MPSKFKVILSFSFFYDRFDDEKGSVGNFCLLFRRVIVILIRMVSFSKSGLRRFCTWGGNEEEKETQGVHFPSKFLDLISSI